MNGSRHWPGFLVTLFFALGLGSVSAASWWHEGRLAVSGSSSTAVVTFSDLLPKQQEVRVRLASGQVVKLDSWHDSPVVGQRLDVVVAGGRRPVARERGSFPWWDAVGAGLLALLMALISRDAWIHVRARERGEPPNDRLAEWVISKVAYGPLASVLQQNQVTVPKQRAWRRVDARPGPSSGSTFRVLLPDRSHDEWGHSENARYELSESGCLTVLIREGASDGPVEREAKVYQADEWLEVQRLTS